LELTAGRTTAKESLDPELCENRKPGSDPAEPCDHHEDVGVQRLPASDIPRQIREGQIDHALVVARLLW
jgi:hypothetical protein